MDEENYDNYIDERIFIHKYLELLDYGLKDKDIAYKMGFSPSSLSRRLNRLYDRGLLRIYFNVFLDRLRSKTWVYMVSFNQRISVDKCMENIRVYRPTTVYYSPIPRPTYILYYVAVGREPLREDDLDREYCDIELSGPIENVAQPIEKPGRRDVYFKYSHDIFTTNNIVVDDIDEYISKIFYKVFNPPMIGRRILSVLTEKITHYIPPNVFRYHYYSHLYGKVIRKRIIFREPSIYSLVILHTTSLEKLEKILSILYEKNILNGIDQVNILSEEPITALVHCWIREDNIWSHNIIHKNISDTRYDVYPVMVLEI